MTDSTRGSTDTTDIQDKPPSNPSGSKVEVASSVSSTPTASMAQTSRPDAALSKHTPRGFEHMMQNASVRMTVVVVLVLLLLIPLSMVESVVGERQHAYQMVLDDISSHWGKEQVVVGPMLVVPYTETYHIIEKKTDSDGRVVASQTQHKDSLQAVLLPKKIHLEGQIKPEYRLRGLYRSLVYSEKLTLSGAFENIESVLRSLGKEGREQRVDWNNSYLVVGLSDSKGITRIEPFQFNHRKVSFAPGTRVTSLIASGFHAPLTDLTPVEDANFKIEMDIKGSTGFRMAPVGELSEMHLTSPWAHPSFYGDILPSKRTVSDQGFEATWSIPHLVRSYPQHWISGKDTSPSGIGNFCVGVRLFEPVTIYTEATRAAKYGVLFIALTFLTLVLLELVTKSRPSMLQYVMIGAALTLFYLLLIALSEHIGFNMAYSLAAGTVIGLNTLYCLSVLSRKSLSLIVMTVLFALYSVLFMTLRAEDYALLTGSILLLIALAVTMFFTRNLHRKA